MAAEAGKRTVACVLLAAGAGSRFGGGKLAAEFHGEALYKRAMDVLPKGALVRTAVVSGSEDILAESARRGFIAVRNTEPERGVSHSIRLGLAAAEPCDAALFLVGDQPLLTRGSVQRILDAGAAHPDRIIAPERPDGQLGNPCLFPAAFFPELRALEGDRGGRRVIGAHPEALFTVSLPEAELFDTDTREALRQLENAGLPETRSGSAF